jgi:transposase
MIDMLKRHEVQVLRRAGHTWKEIAALSGISVRTVRRIAAETDITTIDNAAERARREVGRPSKADAYRDVLTQALTEEPTQRSVELLHRARHAGYSVGKSAIYALVQDLRSRVRARFPEDRHCMHAAMPAVSRVSNRDHTALNR